MGVGILTNPQLSDCGLNWIPLGSQVCMLKLIVKDWSLCLLQVYTPNALSEYQAFVNDINDALQRVRSTKSTILLGDFNAHIRMDSEKWKGVTGRHGETSLNKNGRYLLQHNIITLCIMNIFFQHRDVQSTDCTDLVW